MPVALEHQLRMCTCMQERALQVTSEFAPVMSAGPLTPSECVMLGLACRVEAALAAYGSFAICHGNTRGMNEGGLLGRPTPKNLQKPKTPEQSPQVLEHVCVGIEATSARGMLLRKPV